VLLPDVGRAACEDGGCRTYSHDPSVRRAFVMAHPEPTEPSVVDHVRPRCAGGADATSNMAYEPLEESLLKDALERNLCRRLRAAERRGDGEAAQRALTRYWSNVLALSAVAEIRDRAERELAAGAPGAGP